MQSSNTIDRLIDLMLIDSSNDECSSLSLNTVITITTETSSDVSFKFNERMLQRIGIQLVDELEESDKEISTRSILSQGSWFEIPKPRMSINPKRGLISYSRKRKYQL